MMPLKQAAAVVCAIVVVAAAMWAGVPVNAGAQQGEEITIVAIDTEKILESHPAFIDAKKQFESEVKGIQKKLESMDQQEQLQSQQQLQQNLQQRGEELQKSALKEMKEDIRRIAEEKGYDYVVDSNLLIVGGRNVTDEVLAAMKENPKGEGSK